MSGVARNLGALLSSQVVTWGFTLLLTVFLSRALGASAMGKLQLGASLWAVAAMFMSGGMDVLLVKEVARGPARRADLFGTALWLRGLLGLVAVGALALYVEATGYGAETRAVVYIIAAAGFITQLGEVCRSTLQGLERMEYVALGAITSKAFTTIVSLGLLALGHGVLAISAVTIGSAVLYVVTQLAPLVRLRAARLRLDGSLARWMLTAGRSYFLMATVLVAYQQVDAVVISLIVDEAMVGWYGAAEKLFRTAMFIPTLFVAAVFPTLSRQHAGPPHIAAAFMGGSVRLMLAVAIPVGLGIAALAEPLVLMLFGDGFARSGPVLAALGCTIIFTYPNVLLGHFAMATDRQNRLTWLLSIALVASIALDLVLVPWCQRTFGNGALGGALAYVVTEGGIFVGCLRLLPPGTLVWSDASRIARAALAGVIAAATAWWFSHLFIAIPIGAAALTYAGLAGLLRVAPWDDWRTVKALERDARGQLGA